MSEVGSISERDEQGRIVKRDLSSEQASKMANVRWQKQRDDNLGELLRFYGYEDVDKCPADIRELASKAISTKSGSVSALIHLMKLRPRNTLDVSEARYDPRYPCPLCGSVGQQAMSVEFAREMVRLGKKYMDDPEAFSAVLAALELEYPPSRGDGKKS